MSKGLKAAVVPALLFALLLLVGAVDAWSSSAAAPNSLKVEVIGKGKVTGGGMNCGLGGSTCFASYGGDVATVTLKPAAGSGWHFDHWEDDPGACGTTNDCPVTLSGDDTATAVFSTTGVIQTASYGVGVSGSGSVKSGSTGYKIDCSDTVSSCNLVVPVDSVITVEQSPSDGSLFGGWGGKCTGKGISCTVQVSGNSLVSASFVTAAAHTLTVKADGGGSISVGGITCTAGATCDISEPAGSTVTVSASAQSGYSFTEWSGDCTGNASSCIVQMDDDRSVTATFDPLVPVLITVNGNGKVSGAGITCGPGPTTCQGNAASGTFVLLTATPATGSSVSWSGCTSVSGTICRISVSSTPVAITATFSGGTPPPSTFTLALDVSGNGYVTSSNGSIYCTATGGAGCTASLQQNSTVTLTAVPASGATADFKEWTDDCDFATTTTCTLTMNGAKSVSAAFTGADTTYTLSAQVQGTGSGTISGAGLKCSSSGGTGCSSPQAATATVTLSATPGAGSTFTGWGGACTGTASTCKVQMTAAKSVTATFAGSPSSGGHSLTITVTGAGTVKAIGGICTAPARQTRVCSQEYASGTKVTLTATPATGLAFLGWKGACTGTKATCTLTMTASATVTASFGVRALAAVGKPLVVKTKTGYRVTLSYRAGEDGTLTLTATRAGKHFLTRSVRARVGAGKQIVTFTKRGRYVFTLTLTSKSGRHSVHWAVVR